MKRAFSIIGLVLLVGMLLFWWFSQEEGPTSSREQTRRAQGQPTATGQPSIPFVTPKTKGQIIREGLAALNHQPIEFYGKAVDQYGNPVVGADVICSVIVRNGFREGLEKHNARTAEDGTFQLKGFSGESIGVAVQKSGYEQAPNSGGFKYSLMYRNEAHKPDAGKPVVFRMWKLRGPEPMVKSGGAPMIPCDGTPVYFDLLKGAEVSSGGDLKLMLDRNPINIESKKPFDWRARVEVLNGGLIEVAKDICFPYEAPEGGYRSTFEAVHKAGEINWVDRADLNVFVKLRGGKVFGRITIRMPVGFQPPPTQWYLESWLNPSGSRNLEWDPRLRVEVSRIREVGLEQAVAEVKGQGGKPL